ncbi:MAG: hypothetical protein CYPHOPRED_000874 [Cyphobasidiales sp. Tagirdzhanova-0007]|nr:MAG: hypothetical protein CYPHOPRED_000874 [Cyphobasidiales sp. Tagirdzhanova-0007]
MTNIEAETSKRQLKSTAAVIHQTEVSVDSDGIPISAPYSVTSFLSALPTPKLTDEQFLHLHKLAALVPPATGTPDFSSKKSQLEELIRLVEGVRGVEAQSDLPPGRENTDMDIDEASEIPDGRIWPGDEGIALDWDRDENAILKSEESPEEGRKLLDLASKKHMAGYYTVPMHRKGDVE